MVSISIPGRNIVNTTHLMELHYIIKAIAQQQENFSSLIIASFRYIVILLDSHTICVALGRESVAGPRVTYKQGGNERAPHFAHTCKFSATNVAYFFCSNKVAKWESHIPLTVNGVTQINEPLQQNGIRMFIMLPINCC